MIGPYHVILVFYFLVREKSLLIDLVGESLNMRQKGAPWEQNGCPQTRQTIKKDFLSTRVCNLITIIFNEIKVTRNKRTLQRTIIMSK